MDYLTHLNENRWTLVKHINGKGLEISNNTFTVLPRAIKLVTDDTPVTGDHLRFKVADLHNPIEIEDESLDFVFVTGERARSFTHYKSKLRVGGRLLLHVLDGDEWNFEIYHKSITGLDRYVEPVLPEKNVMVIRYGAIGDLFQAASVCVALKKQGYHVTILAQGTASTVLQGNPYLDTIIATDKDIVRNSELRMYWDWLETQYHKVVNLCGSVEDALLPNHTRPQFYWPAKMRNKYLNVNYVKFQHELAEVPYKLEVKFYPTAEEIAWADEERAKMSGKKLICWALNGSSLHKVMPHADEYFARVMLMLPNVDVITLGGDDAVFLEQGWEEEPRIHRRSGKWSIRQSLTFIQRHADLLVGPETGLLNAMCCEKLQKILFLSHSTKQNLSEDWTNTISMSVPMKDREDCIHRLFQNDQGWKYLKRDEETGTAVCAAKIDRTALWNHTVQVMK